MTRNTQTEAGEYDTDGRSADIVAVSDLASTEWYIETRGADGIEEHNPDEYDARMELIESVWDEHDAGETDYCEATEIRIGTLTAPVPGAATYRTDIAINGIEVGDADTGGGEEHRLLTDGGEPVEDDDAPVPWEFDLSKPRPEGVSEPAPVARRRRKRRSDDGDEPHGD
jgi:hypothetical protein